jgi:hypothetical protein
MPVFDRYVTVDWSASNEPKTGVDSIWICDLQAHAAAETVNPSTRAAAERHLRSVLVQAVKRNERVLIGFDFPYGYPRGLAAALGLDGPAWLAIWRYLAGHLKDSSVNRSNRFEVAAQANRELGHHMFWGRPAAQHFNGLSQLSYDAHAGRQALGLSEWREAEVVLHRKGQHPQSTWKLSGAGSVGSQTLTGIPVLWRLRFDPELSSVSRVWPFEVTEPDLPAGRAAIVHGEIWPGLETVIDRGNRIKDQAQVIAVAERFRRMDQASELQTTLKAPPLIAAEEGWILGVPASSESTAAYEGSETSDETTLRLLETGPVRHFADRSTDHLPTGPGIYTIWRGDQFMYVGVAGRQSRTAEDSSASRSLGSRLYSHASGRRSGDQFCIAVCDRLVLPTLDGRLGEVASREIQLDSLTKAYIHTHLAFRCATTPDFATALRQEASIKRTGLRAAGKPFLNPGPSSE